MSKLNTAKCKELIVEYVLKHEKELEQQFVPPESMTPATLVKNWKRRGKDTRLGVTEREFDCTPYDDQLRAYVTSYANGTIDIVVQGE